MAQWVFYLGLTAATFTAVAFFPQVVKLWKTKETKDISLMTFSILTTGTALWLTYGAMIRDIPIILTNTAILILNSIIIILKLKYK